MDVFELRKRLIDTYRDYATSFMRIRDDRVRSCVDDALDSGRLWPHPRVGLNPSFESGGTIDELVAEGEFVAGLTAAVRLLAYRNPCRAFEDKRNSGHRECGCGLHVVDGDRARVGLRRLVQEEQPRWGQ